MVNINLDEIIENLDEEELKGFHERLVKKGYYEDHIDLDDLGDDVDDVRNAVKIAVQRTAYDDLKSIAPSEIKDAIEELDVSTLTSSMPVGSLIEAGKQDELLFLEKKQRNEEKAKIYQELLQIVSQKGRNNQIPMLLRDRYSELLTILARKYNVPQVDISERLNIHPTSVSSAIIQFLKRHPDFFVKPDPLVQEATDKATTKTLTKVVKKQVDTLVEDSMDLALYITKKWEHEAFKRGLTIKQLVETAISAYLGMGDTYLTMLKLERENNQLKTILSKQIMEGAYAHKKAKRAALAMTIFE